MRRALIVLAALLVSGCSVPAKIEVINNTGQTVEVLLGQGRWVLSSTVLRITPTQSRLTRLARLRDPGLRLRAGDCEYAYDLPRLSAFNSRHVVAVEADFTITGLRDVWKPAILQKDSVLRPVSKTCR